MKLYSNCRTMILLIFIFVCSAPVVAMPYISTPIAEPHEKHDNTCGFVGNPDLYGLGIRLGVYFQWIAAFIVSNWRLKGRRELAKAYLSFVFALTIAMIKSTFQKEQVHTAEILLLAYIIFGGTIAVVYACKLPRSDDSTSDLPAPILSVASIVPVTSLATAPIFFAASAYCSWFWLYGHHHGFLETPCGTFGFLFARVSLENPYITKLFAALSIFIGVIFGCKLLLLLFISILSLLKVSLPVEAVKKFQPLKRPQEPKTHQSKLERATHCLIFIIFTHCMVGMELTIYWNSISGVYTINTTGQLIPFIIGLIGLANTFDKPLLRYIQRHWVSSTVKKEHDSKSVQVSLSDEACEAHDANRRLGYLDLRRPVHELTIHEWRQDGLERRNAEA